jgi:hypothetical protein
VQKNGLLKFHFWRRKGNAEGETMSKKARKLYVCINLAHAESVLRMGLFMCYNQIPKWHCFETNRAYATWFYEFLNHNSRKISLHINPCCPLACSDSYQINLGSDHTWLVTKDLIWILEELAYDEELLSTTINLIKPSTKASDLLNILKLRKTLLPNDVLE